MSILRRLDLGDQVYDFAFVGTSSLHHLQSAADRVAALTGLHKHTRPRGGLGLELWYPSSQSWSSPWRSFDPVHLPGEGALKVWKRGKAEFDVERCLLTITQEVYIERDGQIEQFPHAFSLQLFDRETLATELNAAGYTIVQEYGSHTGEPRRADSPKWIIEAIRS